MLTAMVNLAITNPLITSITDAGDRSIKRSLAFDLAYLQPNFVEHYEKLKKEKRINKGE
jgi:hypothetical protein